MKEKDLQLNLFCGLKHNTALTTKGICAGVILLILAGI
jgi:hypothetical protein